MKAPRAKRWTIAATAWSLAFFLLHAGSLSATPQAGDTLRKPDGTEQEVYGLKLPSEALHRIQASRMNAQGHSVHSSDNWKGYQATLTLVDDELFLTEITVLKPSDSEEFPSVRVAVSLEQIFDTTGPVPATWFTGALHEPFEKRLDKILGIDRFLVYEFAMGRLVSVQQKTGKGHRKATPIP